MEAVKSQETRYWVGSGKVFLANYGSNKYYDIGLVTALTVEIATAEMTLPNTRTPGGGTFRKKTRIETATTTMTAHNFSMRLLAYALVGDTGVIRAGAAKHETTLYPNSLALLENISPTNVLVGGATYTPNSLSVGAGTSEIVFVQKVHGGTAPSIAIVNAAANTAEISVVVAGNVITVTVKDDGVNPTSTLAEVIAAIEDNASANALVFAMLGETANATNITDVITETALSGGSGTPMTVNTDYTVDGAGILGGANLADEGVPVTVYYSYPVQELLQAVTKSSAEVSMVLSGKNEDDGDKDTVIHMYRLSVNPSGFNPLSTDSYGELEISAELLADETRPSEVVVEGGKITGSNYFSWKMAQ